jgi:hypothetical protein
MPGGLWSKDGLCSLNNFSYTDDKTDGIIDFKFSDFRLEKHPGESNNEQITTIMKGYLQFLPIYNESLSGNGQSETNLYSSKLNNLKDVTSLYDTGHDFSKYNIHADIVTKKKTFR